MKSLAIFSCGHLWRVFHEAIGVKAVVGASYSWLYRDCWCAHTSSIASKTEQMNMQHSQIRELMLYESNGAITPLKQRKIFVVRKKKAQWEQSTVTRWLKKFCLACKNLYHQTRSGRPKTWFPRPCFKPLKQNRWVALGEYQARASHLKVKWVSLGELHLWGFKQAGHLTIPCGSLSSCLHQKYPELPNCASCY